MRTIIAGSRSITDYNETRKILDIYNRHLPITTVVSGCAAGVDSLGERWAFENDISIVRYPADWASYQNRAGLVRNVQMAHNADALVAIWDGVSPGTRHMIKVARNLGLGVHIYAMPGTAYHALRHPVFK